MLVPTLFALVQFNDWEHAAAVALGLHVWQFGIGTFLQPRVTGESMNLSTLVVVLSLAIWGTLWGVAGAFLAAPLTVLVMIVLAQFPDTRGSPRFSRRTDGRLDAIAPRTDRRIPDDESGSGPIEQFSNAREPEKFSLNAIFLERSG